jgi:hypothetical protein
MLYFSKACVAQSMASCCISSAMSAFLITACQGSWERGNEGGKPMENYSFFWGYLREQERKEAMV